MGYHGFGRRYRGVFLFLLLGFAFWRFSLNPNIFFLICRRRRRRIEARWLADLIAACKLFRDSCGFCLCLLLPLLLLFALFFFLVLLLQLLASAIP